MIIKQFKYSFDEQWDLMVLDANNGTLFHTRKFLSYHPPGRFTEIELI